MTALTTAGAVQPVHSLAGKAAPDALLVNVPNLICLLCASALHAVKSAQMTVMSGCSPGATPQFPAV